MRKIYDIWSEGYLTSGMEGARATYYGSYEGDTFREACENWAKTLGEDSKKYFDKDDLRFYGCKLFDNGADARKSFG
jgi:hypothetical protein